MVAFPACVQTFAAIESIEFILLDDVDEFGRIIGVFGIATVSEPLCPTAVVLHVKLIENAVAWTFEELGVDSIMVDEAHNFKNLAIFSKMNNVSGISSSGAKKSTDMQLKCQYLSEINDGRGIVFATGTPISNTMCEMYVMQLYLQKAALEEMGIYHFDSWAANFGEVTTALELTVEGSGFRFKSRFNKFTNLPELMNIFREVADVQTKDMLDLPVPALRGGKYIIVESEPDWYVKHLVELNRQCFLESVRRGNTGKYERWQIIA